MSNPRTRLQQQISLDPERAAWLREEAKRTDLSMSQLVRRALDEYRSRHPEGDPTVSNFPYLTEGPLANYRVTGPNGQGPFEVQATSLLEAAQAALQQHPKELRGIDGIDQPRGENGPVVAYYQIKGSHTRQMGTIGTFEVAFVSWVA